MKIATCEANANIAVVKYWGKRNAELILPTNSSLSFTMELLRTRTTVAFDSSFSSDELWLNGEQIDLTNPEVAGYFRPLQMIREKAGSDAPARVASYNFFPTAAGFASSASGVAALVCAAVRAMEIAMSPEDLSILARRGSGSASRSVMGGFVEWQRGELEDGSDSFAMQIATAEHWPQLRNVIAIVNAREKKIGSRAGMKQTVRTSCLYQERLRTLEQTVVAMKQAVLSRDFGKFAELTMRDSNSMHAVMLDTWPPICYLDDNSREIITAIHELNEAQGKYIAAYTFDAGPNAHVYTTEDHVPVVRQALSSIAGVQEIMVSKIGQGPKYLDNPTDSLLDHQGNPRRAEEITRP